MKTLVPSFFFILQCVVVVIVDLNLNINPTLAAIKEVAVSCFTSSVSHVIVEEFCFSSLMFLGIQLWTALTGFWS